MRISRYFVVAIVVKSGWKLNASYLQLPAIFALQLVNLNKVLKDQTWKFGLRTSHKMTKAREAPQNPYKPRPDFPASL